MYTRFFMILCLCVPLLIQAATSEGQDDTGLTVTVEQLTYFTPQGASVPTTRARFFLGATHISPLVCAGSIEILSAADNGLGTVVITGTFTGRLLHDKGYAEGRARPFYLVVRMDAPSTLHLPPTWTRGAAWVHTRHDGFVVSVSTTGSDGDGSPHILDAEGRAVEGGTWEAADLDEQDPPLPIYIEDETDEEEPEDPIG